MTTGIFLKKKLANQRKFDASRKGTVDEAIVDLVNYINCCENYFTTSSCSGRIYLFENSAEDDKQMKKGCRWLYTTHSECDWKKVEEAVKNSVGEAHFKFEPFVLHVECRTIEYARLLHEVAVASGFRNSGITVGKRGKIIAAVRSTHSLEVPLTLKGELLVSSKYIEYIVELGCQQLKNNFRRVDLFFTNLKKALSNESSAETRCRPKSADSFNISECPADVKNQTTEKDYKNDKFKNDRTFRKQHKQNVTLNDLSVGDQVITGTLNLNFDDYVDTNLLFDRASDDCG